MQKQFQDFRTVVQLIKEGGYRSVGLVTGYGDYHYPIWPMLRRKTKRRIALFEVNVGNPSERLGSPPLPEAVVVTHPSAMKSLDVQGRRFDLIWSGTNISLFAPGSLEATGAQRIRQQVKANPGPIPAHSQDGRHHLSRRPRPAIFSERNLCLYRGRACRRATLQCLAEGTTQSRLFIGHAPIISGIEAADDAEIITFLRDPVRRVKSFCNHVAEGKSPYLREEFPPDRFDLDRFLDSGNNELSNLQTKMLINRADSGSWGSLTTSQLATATDAALDTLFNRLSLYGIQEYFDQSLLLICAHFRWKTPLYRPLNERKGNGLIFEERHLARIAELNALDIAVYRRAAEHFPEVLRRGGCTSGKLKRFRFLNSVIYPRFLFMKWMLSRRRS